MTTTQASEAAIYENIELDLAPPLATITINRPKVLNALSHATRYELAHAIETLAGAADIRAIVITGSGSRAFCAGADIAELEALNSAQQGYEHSRASHELLADMERLSKPVIMAVNGYALGGGCELAMAGDIIVASENAQFGQPEVSLGIIPGFGGTQRLPRLVGRTKALELILTGDRIGAQEALALGLVNRVVPQDQLLEVAREIGNKIAQKGPLAIALAKRAVYEGLEVSPTAGNDLEKTFFGLAVGTEDRKEGTKAFLEKRQPEWQGK